MDKVRVVIGDKTYDCQVAKTEEDKKKGLMGVENLPPDEGMLFQWEDEDSRQMWMKNTKIPLDQIAINGDDEVVMVYIARPEDETLVTFPNAKYILEVNANSGIVEGDEFDIDDSEDLNKYVMKILAQDGSTQMYLQGGERIFSRISTKQMIKWAKKADAVKDKEEQYNKICRRLGKRLFRELYAQDHREPQYVDSPKKDSSDDKTE